MNMNLFTKGLFASAFVCFAANVMAADVNVTDAAGLISAVNNAQSGDRILLASGTYKLTASVDISGKDITIEGVGLKQGEPAVILDGQGQVRVINVHANANAVVNNVKIINGYAEGGSNGNSGAGIRVDGGSLKVNNCVFEDNFVEGAEANWTGGAGIHSNNAKLTVEHSEFYNGSAYQGGAIVLQNSDAEISYTRFEGNVTDYAAGGIKNDAKGGAICVRSDNGTVHTHNFNYCVFLNNKSYGHGGAFSMNVSGGAAGQQTVFQGCAFYGNSTNIDIPDEYNELTADLLKNDSRGGAIYIDTDGKVQFTLQSCTFSHNYSKGGGAMALMNFKNQETGKFSMINCTVTDNHNLDNSGNGAAVYINENAKDEMNFINNIITGNWSVKVNNATYEEELANGEEWKSWEYSDFSGGGSFQGANVYFYNNIIGYTNVGEKFVNFENILLQKENYVWIEGEDAEGQLGDLAAWDEYYFCHPFNSSAESWLEYGSAEKAKEYGCVKDQLGNDLTDDVVGAVQADEMNIGDNDELIFVDADYTSGSTSGIQNVGLSTRTGNDAIYTIGGVRVSAPAAKGIYIKNGKKFIK